jgi:hypothetical protein
VKLLSLQEAADELGLTSTGSLRVQIREGKLRATKVGKTWVVTPREIERYGREHLGRGRRTDLRRPRLKSLPEDSEPRPPKV